MNTHPLYQKLIVLPSFAGISLKYFWLFSSILVAALLVFYIFQINALISESYLVQSFQKKITEMSERNKVSEIELTKLNYLENIAPKIQELGLERIGTIHYIQVIDASVAALHNNKVKKEAVTSWNATE